MTHSKKIRATYKNGVIELLDKINLPDGQELEVELKAVPSLTSELSYKKMKKFPPKTQIFLRTKSEPSPSTIRPCAMRCLQVSASRSYYRQEA